MKLYTIGLYFKPIQIYIDTIRLHYKAKLLVSISILKY